MSASMIAPSLPAIASDLAISASTAQITMSVYFLGMAFAPFLIVRGLERAVSSGQKHRVDDRWEVYGRSWGKCWRDGK
jgi:MFS family permease